MEITEVITADFSADTAFLLLTTRTRQQPRMLGQHLLALSPPLMRSLWFLPPQRLVGLRIQGSDPSILSFLVILAEIGVPIFLKKTSVLMWWLFKAPPAQPIVE